MAPQEFFSQLSLLMVNLCFKSCTFCLFFNLYLSYIYNLHVWIRIHNTATGRIQSSKQEKIEKCSNLGNEEGHGAGSWKSDGPPVRQIH